MREINDVIEKSKNQIKEAREKEIELLSRHIGENVYRLQLSRWPGYLLVDASVRRLMDKRESSINDTRVFVVGQPLSIDPENKINYSETYESPEALFLEFDDMKEHIDKQYKAFLESVPRGGGGIMHRL